MKTSIPFLLAILYVIISFRYKVASEKLEFIIPSNFPKPEYNFQNNPLTEEGFQLGRNLFYDPILSRDSTISCASCHLQFTGFAHVDHEVSHGIDGRKGNRNVPALINLAWNKFFHWDGGVNNLEVQGINPVTHPNEMDNSLEEVIFRLKNSNKYRLLFAGAFGDNEVTTARIFKAITQFVVALVSSDSKYDKVMRKEEGLFFTDQEKKGYKLFKSYCASCHTEPLFTNDFFASNGLKLDSNFLDYGRFGITLDPNDKFLFKIPTLRNIEFTYPYMHDGRFSTLKEVLEYYNEMDHNNEYVSKPLKKTFTLSENNKKDLLAFLLTLTDKSFLFNQRFFYPK
jgi:cytochrome c peroxidase